MASLSINLSLRSFKVHSPEERRQSLAFSAQPGPSPSHWQDPVDAAPHRPRGCCGCLGPTKGPLSLAGPLWRPPSPACQLRGLKAGAQGSATHGCSSPRPGNLTGRLRLPLSKAGLQRAAPPHSSGGWEYMEGRLALASPWPLAGQKEAHEDMSTHLLTHIHLRIRAHTVNTPNTPTRSHCAHASAHGHTFPRTGPFTQVHTPSFTHSEVFRGLIPPQGGPWGAEAHLT